MPGRRRKVEEMWLDWHNLSRFLIPPGRAKTLRDANNKYSDNDSDDDTYGMLDGLEGNFDAPLKGEKG